MSSNPLEGGGVSLRQAETAGCCSEYCKAQSVAALSSENVSAPQKGNAEVLTKAKKGDSVVAS